MIDHHNRIVRKTPINRCEGKAVMLDTIAALPQPDVLDVAPMITGTAAAMLWRGDVGRMKPLPFFGWSALVTVAGVSLYGAIGMAEDVIPYLPALAQGVVVAAAAAALCRLGAARGRDAWGRDDLGWVSVVPFLNILPLFAPSAPDGAGSRK